MITRHDPRRPTRGFLAVLVALVLVLAASCSDAPTEAQIEMADDGVDPSIISIFVPEQLQLTVEQLGTAFLVDHPGITFQYTANTSEVLSDRVRQGFEPSMWIDDSAVLEPFLDDPAAQGAPVTIGDDPLQFVVTKKYPGPEPTLAVFGAGTSPARSGLCEEAARCGASAREMLAELDIAPAPDLVRPSGRDLVTALNEDEIDTAIVYRSDSARLFTIFKFIALPDPDIGRILFQSLRFTAIPVTLEFQTWIQTSPDAEAILRKNGYIPRVRTPHPVTAAWNPPGERGAVLVTGMHRSGTSFAARTLELLGVSLGRPEGLLAPGSDNPAGYWENRAIQELDDELLAHLDGSWDQPPVLDPGWEQRDGLDPFVVRALAVLDRDFRDAAALGPIGFKDPRLSLLLPFWRRVLPVRTTVTLARDPRDVAASLATRNGFTPAESSVLWLRYLLAATRDDPGHLLLVHDAFFDDLDVTLDRIADHVGAAAPDDAVRAAVRSHLDPGLTHHRSRGDAPASPTNPLERLALEVWNDGSPDLGALDDVVADGFARGRIRSPADGAALGRARAEAVSFKEQLKRRNEVVKALKEGRPPPPPLPETPSVDPGSDAPATTGATG